METEKIQTLPPPPGIINALKAGFDVIATNISLILLPIGLDLLLWLGPRLRVSQLFEPLLADISQQVAVSKLPLQRIEAMQIGLNGMVRLLQDFNLVSSLRTFPVGVFSLMSGVLPATTPFGNPASIQLDTDASFVLWSGLLLLTGWVLGGLFFGQVANSVRRQNEQPVTLRPGRIVAQTIFLSIVWMVILFGLGVPFLFFLSLLGFLNTMLAQGALLVLAMLSMSILVPFFFMPHGIFLKNQNAFNSIWSSFRMARFTLPTSSLFVLSVLLISYGMNLLWAIPAAGSWMALVGIAGHAFVTTSLLAASFIYYRDISAWLQTVLDTMKAAMPARQA